jgi:hypothetical protein
VGLYTLCEQYALKGGLGCALKHSEGTAGSSGRISGNSEGELTQGG